MRLAEDTATLDLLSGGRLDAGFGRGQAGYEYTGYSVEHEESQERFQESIHIIEGLWTTPDFSYEGKHYQVQNTNLVPPPVQKPHPPMYIAATRSQETQDFAAASGHSGIIGVVLDTSDGLDLCYQLVEGAAEAGHPMDLGGIPFFRYFYVAETEKQARRDAEPTLNWTLDVNQWRRTYKRGSEVYDNLEEFKRSRNRVSTVVRVSVRAPGVHRQPGANYRQDPSVAGCGYRVLGLQFFVRAGWRKTRCSSRWRLFAREVMPEFS